MKWSWIASVSSVFSDDELVGRDAGLVDVRDLFVLDVSMGVLRDEDAAEGEQHEVEREVVTREDGPESAIHTAKPMMLA